MGRCKVFPRVCCAVMLTATSLFGVGCTSGASSTAENDAASTLVERARLPDGWPGVLALAPDAVIVDSLSQERDGAARHELVVRQPGVGQHIFAVFADALRADGWQVDERRREIGRFRYERFLIALKGSERVTVRLKDSADGPVTFRLTHSVFPRSRR